MVKKGPCSHCRVNCTPLWRNGPAEKPVLCNACGSRYKLKGHLQNYLPKHHKYYGELHLNVEDQLSEHNGSSNESSPDLHYVSEQDFGNIPTRKRSEVVYREMTPLERFEKQLLSLYRSEKQPKERFPEEDTLVDNVNNFIPTTEIGLGLVLLRQIRDHSDFHF
ncbi:hypothetical protein ACSQ67_013298 [Phaseolus vulgaris]